MGVPKVKTKVTAEEYLVSEKTARIKHEFVGGEVYEMAGAGERHHRICLNLVTNWTLTLLAVNVMRTSPI
jgi:Uma2 family endonuclease